MSRLSWSGTPLILLLAAIVQAPPALMQSTAPAPSALFADDFEHGLDRWDVIGRNAVAIAASGDPRHGSVLVLMPNGDAAALVRGSEAWGAVRVEGEMMFPSPIDNYLGFLYHFTARAGRRDFGLIYVKGNDSYMQVNPHRDFNVSRLIYPEFHVPLAGQSAVVTGQWQRFAFEVAGPAAHVYIGGATTPHVTFAGFEGRRGAVGLQPRSVGGPVWVDNIAIRAIPRLSYSGPAIPSITYTPGALLTNWEVAGPFDRTNDALAIESASPVWTRFATDERGCIVTGRVVEYHGTNTVAYFRTVVESARDEEAQLHLSTADDLAVWVNGVFASFVSRQDAAWHDLAVNAARPVRRVPLDLKRGRNEIVVRARGGVYASGGFFARISHAP
jgi:hypothetical protein